MASVFFVRHPAGHYNEKVVFAQRPTNAQRDAVLAHDDQRYGVTTDDEWRNHPACVHEVQLVTDATVPTFEA